MLTENQKAIRLGRFTASTIEKLMKPKGIGEGGMTYIYEKAGELMTGKIKEIPVSYSMQWGIDNEPLALQHLEAVLNTNFPESDSVVKGIICGTPDRIGVEIKCPNTDTHLYYGSMLSGNDLKSCKPEYYWQIQTYMYLFDRKNWLFVSYDPRVLIPKKQMFVFTVDRNDADILLLNQRVLQAGEILKSIME